MTDWVEITRRNARSVQTTIGWIFWDPGAVERYERLGLPGPARLHRERERRRSGRAGADAVIAAFGSISPLGIRLAFDLVAQHTTFDAVWNARDEAVRRRVAARTRPRSSSRSPRSARSCGRSSSSCRSVGRVFFAAHLRMPRPGRSGAVGLARGQLPARVARRHALGARRGRGSRRRRGVDPAQRVARLRARLAAEVARVGARRRSTRAWACADASAGLVRAGEVTPEGIALRQRIEDDTDRLTTASVANAGRGRARAASHDDFEPPCAPLLHRVDITAGPNYQPASRIR